MPDLVSKRILITGGSGFIGRHVVDLLAADGNAPLTTARQTMATGDLRGPKTVGLDVADQAGVEDLIGSYRPDLVVHLAGVTGHNDPDGRLCREVNYTGTVNLLKALEKHGVERVVLIGSAGEYGDHPTPFREPMEPRPTSHYAASKAEANQFALKLHADSGLPVTILRVFTSWGYGQPSKMFFSQVIKHGLANSRFVMSDGLQKRDFVHVADVARAIRSSLFSEGAVGRVINIGSGRGTALRDLASEIWELCGADPALLDIGGRGKTGEDSYDTVADITLAGEVLDWHPATFILDGIDSRHPLTQVIERMRRDSDVCTPR